MTAPSRFFATFAAAEHLGELHLEAVVGDGRAWGVRTTWVASQVGPQIILKYNNQATPAIKVLKFHKLLLYLTYATNPRYGQ